MQFIHPLAVKWEITEEMVSTLFLSKPKLLDEVRLRTYSTEHKHFTDFLYLPAFISQPRIVLPIHTHHSQV